MEIPLYMGTHVRVLSRINNSVSILFSQGWGHGSSDLPIWRSPSRITAGQGKNSEHRGKWYSWVSSADSWLSTLWLELILPKATTCASKQMGNEILEEMPHFKSLNYHLSSKLCSLILHCLVKIDTPHPLLISHLIFTQTTTKWKPMSGQTNAYTILMENGLQEQKQIPKWKILEILKLKMKVIQLLRIR